MIQDREQCIDVTGLGTVSTLWSGDSAADTVVILAHGAGNDMHTSFLKNMSHAFADAGFLCIRFNFLYKEQGRKAPDRTPVLEATWRAVLDHVSKHAAQMRRLVLAGKSMGGRIASMIVAHDAPPVAGLVFFGYPLHPPGKLERMRCAHLPMVHCPMLFIQGTRDALCDMQKLRSILSGIPNATIHEITGGDHSFKVLKKLQRDPAEVIKEIAGTATDWVRGLKVNT